jgi:hypothetical protein
VRSPGGRAGSWPPRPAARSDRGRHDANLAGVGGSAGFLVTN